MRNEKALLGKPFFKMIRAVLDTNVFISALFWKGAPHDVFQLGLRGAFSILTSEEILKELQTKLLYKFELPVENARAFLEIIALNSEAVVPKKKLRVVLEDPADNKIVECAEEGRAQCIVTGDSHLLRLKKYDDIKIVKPAEFLKIISYAKTGSE